MNHLPNLLYLIIYLASLLAFQGEAEALPLDWRTILVLAGLAAPCITTLLIISVGLFFRIRKQRQSPDK